VGLLERAVGITNEPTRREFHLYRAWELPTLGRGLEDVHVSSWLRSALQSPASARLEYG
jgi:hypothetical protein